MTAAAGSPPAAPMVRRRKSGSGLPMPKVSAPQTAAKRVREAERVEQTQRKPFELVGADREAESAAGERIERPLDSRKRPRMVGDMVSIMRNEVAHHSLDFHRRQRAPSRRKATFDQHACAAAHHVARRRVVDRRQALAGERSVQRSDEIGRGIDQRPVEIEDNKGSHHDCRSLPAKQWNGKPPAAALPRLDYARPRNGAR